MKNKSKKPKPVRIGKDVVELWTRKAGPHKDKKDKRSKNKDQKQDYLKEYDNEE